MASENPPILFQARPPEHRFEHRPQREMLSTYHGVAEGRTGEGRATWPLVHALTATLNQPNPLLSLTEVLGLHLGAGACLLLCHHPSSDGLFYCLWHRGDEVVTRSLSATPTQEHSHRIALEIIHQTLGQAAGQGRLAWQRGLSALLGDGESSPDWLRKVAACTAIAIPGADLRGAMLLLGTQAVAIDQVAQINLASLGAIALHQHHLQSQAQRHAEQLRYLQHLKEDFLSTLNHELRTPLTSMMLAIRMLRRPDLTPDRAAMYLDILEQQCNREIGLVNDLLMLQSLDAKASPVAQQSVDLVALLAAAAAPWQDRLNGADLTLELGLPPQPVLLATDPQRLTKVLHELLGNAQKYSAPGTTITLALDDGRAEGQPVTLQLSNLGAAIEAEDLPHVFDKFRRGRNATRDGIAGTGTGLALVRGLVDELGGTIAVSSQPVDKTLWLTRFSLNLRQSSPPA